jgi:glutamyl-tRNA reductase
LASAAYDGSQREMLQEGNIRYAGSRGLLLVGASYKTANLESRERMAKLLSSEKIEEIHSLPGVEESALLKTCNRLELYLVTRSSDLTNRALTDMFGEGLSSQQSDGAIFSQRGPQVVAHLFKVAAGLDSVVPGEPQILSQVRSTGKASHQAGRARGTLSPLFVRASRVGTRIRASYGIGSGEASLSDLAVKAVLKSVNQKPNVLLVGTGKMVQLAVKRLQGKGRMFYVASKRKEVPKGLAKSRLIPYQDIPKIAASCDVIISATAVTEPLLSKVDLAGRKKRIVVDLGMPRNISSSVRELPNVRLLDLDDLARMAPRPRNPKTTKDAEEAVAKEASEFYAWLVQTRFSSTLSDIFAWANEVREAELVRATRKLGPASAREKRIVEAMGRRIVSKLMSRPAGFARRKYWALTEEEKLTLLRSVFGLHNASED